MDATNHSAIRIHAAAHLERIERTEIRVAVDAIVPIDRHGRRSGASLPESDRVGQHVRTACFGPLIAIHHPTAEVNAAIRSATGDRQFDGPAPRRQCLAAHINQPLRRVRSGRRIGRRVGVLCRPMHQQLFVCSIRPRRRTRQLHQHRPRRKAYHQSDVSRVGNARVPGTNVGRDSVIAIAGATDAVVETDIARVSFVVQGKQHHVLPGCVRAFPIIVALEGNDILVAPPRPRAASGQLIVQVANIGDRVITFLAQVIGEGNNRRSRSCVVIEAIRIDHRQSLVHEIIRILQLLVDGTASAAILRLREHHALRRAVTMIGRASAWKLVRRRIIPPVHAVKTCVTGESAIQLVV